jgi:hypothetical protein
MFSIHTRKKYWMKNLFLFFIATSLYLFIAILCAKMSSVYKT